MLTLAVGIGVCLAIAVGLLCWASYELGYRRGWDERGFRLSRRTIQNLKPFDQEDV